MIRRLLTLVLLGAGFYIAYQYAHPQIDAWRFRDSMTQTARLAGAIRDDEMRASLMGTADDLGIPLDDRNLRIHREPGGRIVVSATWEEIVTLDGGPLGIRIDTLYYAYEAASIERKRR